MFYSIENNKISQIKAEETESGITVGYLTLDELAKYQKLLQIDQTVLEECMADRSHFRTSLDVYDEYSFGMINIVNMDHIMGERDRVAFVIGKRQFFLIELEDKDGSTRNAFRASLGRFKLNVTIEKVIFGILEKLLEGGSAILEKTEEKIMELEEQIVNGKIDKNLNREIFERRNRLTMLKTYYDQLVELGGELQENENALFEEENLRYFKIFTDKAGRLSLNTQTLCENLIHLREALDASLNYSMNRSMRVFTVVSIIFLPLTLIVGWYGMNFTTMPELTWKYGYLFVILLSIGVLSFCLFYFKKKKIM